MDLIAKYAPSILIRRTKAPAPKKQREKDTTPILSKRTRETLKTLWAP